MSPRLVSGFERVGPERQADGAAVRLGLLPPERKERADDAVRALRLDARGGAARDEPVEDRLHLVGRRVPGRPQTVGRERVADLAQLLLRRASSPVDDLRPEHLAAEARVLGGLLAPQSVVDVERGDARSRAPAARARGRSSRHPRRRAPSPLPRRDELQSSDVRLDPGQNVHERRVRLAVWRSSPLGATIPACRES